MTYYCVIINKIIFGEKKMRNYIKGKGIKGLLFSIIVALVFFILSITKAFSTVDNLIMDIYQKPSTTSSITIIAI